MTSSFLVKIAVIVHFHVKQIDFFIVTLVFIVILRSK